MSLRARLLRFVEDREDATSLALCRIIACSTVLAHVVHFQTSGAAQFSLVHRRFGGLGIDDAWLAFMGGATPANVSLLLAVLGASALLGAIGLFTRPALVVAWLGMRAMTSLNVDARGSYDQLLINILFLLVFSGCAHAFSVDARGGSLPREVARWPRILIVLQIGLMYGGSSLMKASSGWVPGGDASALWYILHQPMWVRHGIDSIPLWALPITQVATTCVWLWEFMGPLFVVSVLLRERPSSRPWTGRLGRALDRVRFRELYLLFGVAMHLGIELTMEVGAFTFASFALYPAALRPDEWRAFFAKLKDRARSRDTSRSPASR